MVSPASAVSLRQQIAKVFAPIAATSEDVPVLVEAIWPLIEAWSDARVEAAVSAARAEGRNDAARDIEAHRAKHAPIDGNLAQRRMSRHLGIAARVAQGPINIDDVAAALARSVPDG